MFPRTVDITSTSYIRCFLADHKLTKMANRNRHYICKSWMKMQFVERPSCFSEPRGWSTWFLDPERFTAHHSPFLLTLVHRTVIERLYNFDVMSQGILG